MRPDIFTKEHEGMVVLVRTKSTTEKAVIGTFTTSKNLPIQLTRNGDEWYSLSKNGTWGKWNDVSIIKVFTKKDYPEEYL